MQRYNTVFPKSKPCPASNCDWTTNERYGKLVMRCWGKAEREVKFADLVGSISNLKRVSRRPQSSGTTLGLTWSPKQKNFGRTFCFTPSDGLKSSTPPLAVEHASQLRRKSFGCLRRPVQAFKYAIDYQIRCGQDLTRQTLHRNAIEE